MHFHTKLLETRFYLDSFNLTFRHVHSLMTSNYPS